jgi:hypothetical protein
MLVEEGLGAVFASFVCVCLKIIEGWIECLAFVVAFL